MGEAGQGKLARARKANGTRRVENNKGNRPATQAGGQGLLLRPVSPSNQ